MSSTEPEWPPKSGLSTHIVPAQSAILTISAASTTIDAPASFVFAILRNTVAYPAWNSFCPKLVINAQPPETPSSSRTLLHKETIFTLHAIMDPAKPTKNYKTRQRVTDISTPSLPSNYLTESDLQSGSFELDQGKVWRIAWSMTGGLMTKGLKTERFSEVIGMEDGKCLYRTWECQGGVLARTVKWLYERTLKERFETWCADLKRECERRVSEGDGMCKVGEGPS